MDGNFLLVRYGEIGTKSEPVKSKMIKVLRQRVEDRLEYENFQYETVSVQPGRITVENPEEIDEAMEAVSEIPGVSSVSPAYRTDPDIESIKQKSMMLEIGGTFGINTNRSGDHEFDTPQVNEEIGDYIRNEKDSEVDLDDPETWVNFDIREEHAYVFERKIQGPGGIPVGTGESFAALISGGIDSPVAAHEIMKRGSDIVPIYFYNSPVAAEDHFLRFKSVVEKLKSFNPSRHWKAYKIDMSEVNPELINVGSGRMILHRRLMFRVAEKIANKENLKGLVTGESLSQKSSQTASNLRVTSEAVDLPILRPLISHDKKDIVEKAKEIGTYQDAKIASACSTMAPEDPRTKIGMRETRNLEKEVKFEELVETALESIEEIDF